VRKIANEIASLSGNGNVTLPWIDQGTSYFFEGELEAQSSQVPSSSAVSADIGLELFRNILEWKQLPVTPLSVQVFEVEKWEQIIEKLDALESVAGILSELTVEEAAVFDKATKRRPFFE